MSQENQTTQQNQPKQKQTKNQKDQNSFYYSQTNEQMEYFYSHQPTLMTPTEYNLYIETMKQPLPSTFRLTKNEQTPIIRAELHKLINQIQNEDEKPIQLKWYPNDVAYQINVAKSKIDKSSHLAELRQFIIAQTEAGVISRQETVSMIPPLFLDVKPHHDVLDICAAPGSKTTQILEMIHSGEEDATGVVVANDSDFKRCYLLEHQTKRVQSPNIVITNHLAQKFPLKINGVFKKYDRVLCDVPCSGDGTLRKNIDAWPKWNTQRAISLHKEQCTIMKHAVKLVKNGGRFVYSTCSLNPYEDECVVAFILRLFPQIRLVDVSAELPELKRANGISSWNVFDAENKDVTDQKPEFTVEINQKVPFSLYPPTKEEAERFHLERCMRFFPQLQNTGGFFVAVLEKIGDLECDFEDEKQKKKSFMKNEFEKKEEKVEEKKVEEEMKMQEEQIEKKEEKVEETKEVKEQQGKKDGKRNGKKQKRRHDGTLYPLDVTETCEETKRIITEFYGLTPESGFDFECLGVKGDGKQTLHYIVRKGMEFIKASEVKVVGGGLKLFRKHTVNKVVTFRLSNEGLSAVAHLLGEKRKIDITQEDFVKMLLHDDAVALSDDVMKKTESFDMGCVIFRINDESSLLNTQYFSGWKSRGYSLFISRVDKNALCQNLKIKIEEKGMNENEKEIIEKKEKPEEE